MQEVEAVKTAEQLAQLEVDLATRAAIYLDIWKFGINTALRVTDLLSIRMADVHELDAGHPVVEIRETKTGKRRTITLNRGALGVVARRLERHADDAWLFQSTSPRHAQRDPPKPISRKAVGRRWGRGSDRGRSSARTACGRPEVTRCTPPG